MSYEPSQPDLSRLWLTAHDQALAMSFGTTEHGEILTTALPEAAPLLILAQSSDAQKRQVLAWLAQLLSKCGRSGLRLALLEQPGDQKLTRLLQDYAQTVITCSSAQGLIEAIWCLEGTLMHREETKVFSPPWLGVLELSEESSLPARAHQALHMLLARGHGAGLFLLVLARQASAAALALPDLFTSTLVLEACREPSAGSPLQPALPCARLYRTTDPTRAVTVLVPPIRPADVIALLDRYTPRAQSTKVGV
jgi:hypothetical protein